MPEESTFKPALRIPKYDVIDDLNGIVNEVFEVTQNHELRSKLKNVIRKVKDL